MLRLVNKATTELPVTRDVSSVTAIIQQTVDSKTSMQPFPYKYILEPHFIFTSTLKFYQQVLSRRIYEWKDVLKFWVHMFFKCVLCNLHTLLVLTNIYYKHTYVTADIKQFLQSNLTMNIALQSQNNLFLISIYHTKTYFK